MKILIKAMRPHRQKVLTEGGEEMRLQQWANKKAASALREAGGDAGGEQFNQARDALMHAAVNNPEEHGLKFMGERVPFDGQELEESLSAPDVEGEQASIDSEFAPPEDDNIHDEALADWEARQGDIDFDKEQGNTEGHEGHEGKPYHETDQEQLDADKEGFYTKFPNLKPPTPDIFDESGKLRDGTEPEEGKKEFDPDEGAEHLRNIMTSRQVPMRDAWSILKNLQFPADAGDRPEWQRGVGEKHGPNDKFFRYGENTHEPKAHGENPMRVKRPHPYSQLGNNVMEDYQLMQEEPEDNQLLTPDELAFAQSIAENDGQMPPAASMPAPTLREGTDQYNPPANR